MSIRRKRPTLGCLIVFVVSLVLLNSFSVNADLISGLQLSCKLDEGIGNVAGDSSGNGHTGSRYGATWTTGKIDGGLSFDGIDDYVQIPGLLEQPQNVTISVWANLNAKDTSGAEAISLGDYVAIRLDGKNGKGAMGFYYDGTTWRNTPTGIMHAGTGWHHFTYVVDDIHNIQKVYIDGVEKGSTAYTQSISYAGLGSHTFLGRHGNGVGNYDFNGVIDDVRLYNRALSEQEVQDVYNNVDDSIPPDPSKVAPPLDLTVATSLGSATAFLYTGENPIQTGVGTDTIQAYRCAVLRGKVLDRENQPLSGVTVKILDHPEFGQTMSRADGMFDMAVNGGGLMTVKYNKDGYLPVQRQVDVPWEDYAWLPDVVMIPVDTKVNTIDLALGIPMQVAQGNVVSDTDGTRQAMLLFPEGTQASVIQEDGTTRETGALNVHLTEYTVGESGPKAMPAPLPPQSAYTYCIELGADEAQAKINGKDVIFNQPVIFYVDNFLNFPAGIFVPVGYYDNTKGMWIPSDSGRVVKIMSVTDGKADLDTDGDDTADNDSNLGITDPEHERLAALYQPGQSLWRVTMDHLSTWDCNWPFGPPPDAEPPNQPDPDPDDPKDNPDNDCGSIIEVQNQTLGEAVAIAGTPFRLHYQGDRQRGRKINYTLRIHLSGSSVPASLTKIYLTISVAGRIFREEFSNAPNQSYTFTWDSKDAYGRTVQGKQPISVNIGYAYSA